MYINISVKFLNPLNKIKYNSLLILRIWQEFGKITSMIAYNISISQYRFAKYGLFNITATYWRAISLTVDSRRTSLYRKDSIIVAL